MFIDNIYRYSLAGVEVSALLGRMPSAVGYQPPWLKKWVNYKSVLRQLAPSPPYKLSTYRQMTLRPFTCNYIYHLDASIVLSRKIAELGIYLLWTLLTQVASN